MCDKNDSNTLSIKLLDRFHYLCPALWVEHCCRLIKEYAVRSHSNNACYCDSLLLSSRKLVRCVHSVLIHTNCLQCFIDSSSYLLRLYAHIFKSEGYILFNDSCNDLIVGVLKYHSNLLSDIKKPALICNAHSFNSDASLLRDIDTVYALREC